MISAFASYNGCIRTIETFKATSDSRIAVARVIFDGRRFDACEFVRYRIFRPPELVRSVPKRQTEFLAGRIAAQKALNCLGLNVTEIPIGLHRCPIWRHGCHFAHRPYGFRRRLDRSRNIRDRRRLRTLDDRVHGRRDCPNHPDVGRSIARRIHMAFPLLADTGVFSQGKFV